MVEPRPAADDNSPLGRGETVAVPTPTPTDAVSLAWSSDHDIGRQPVNIPSEPADVQSQPGDVSQSWTTVWGRAVAMLLIGIALASVIMVAGWLMTKKDSPATSGPASASTAPATTTPLIAASIVSTPDQDNKYIQDLNERGVEFANPDAAVHNGKMVCQNIGGGMTPQQVVTEFQSSSPALSGVANAYVAISVRTYCPQFSNLVASLG